MWKKLGTLCAILTAVGCTSISQSLQQIRAGMDKGEVLQIAGDPKFTFRENSQDHWAYFYETNGQEWRRDIVFENGKVIRVTKPTSGKNKTQREIENSQNMEEFEAIAREQQRRSDNFKYIDGLPDDGEKSQ
jgi:outer membrane protein assembly factor BamE (lipoprotein component of BamABCDE complex)